jgi:xylulokinase
MLYIGVDLGTSAVKLVLMDESGEIKNVVSEEYPLYFPHTGWSEQKPEDWEKGICTGLAKLLDGYDRGQIDGISFGGQMHGLVVLDSQDNVIRPAILWNDGRTGEECDYLNNTIGKDKIAGYTGNMAFTGFTAPKIIWMKKNEPDNFKKIAKIMLPKDFIAYRLSGVHCTDVSDASGMLLFDVKNRCWSKEMMDICGVSENQLAKVYESYETVGHVTSEASKKYGLPESVKVIAGAGDNAAGAVGTGTTSHGMCSVSIGTSGTVFVATDKFAMDPANSMHSFAHANGKYHFLGCMLSGAACNKWWMDEIIRDTDYKGQLSDTKKFGDNKVFFLPYLMGERTPHNNPDARGAFIGMSMDTTRNDMTQALIEGITFGLRDSIEIARSLGVKIERVRAIGGGAKNPRWCQIVADVMDVKVDRINCEEGPGLGACILAAVGCGKFKSVEEAGTKLIKVTQTIDQEPELVEKYERKYQQWRKMYPALKPIYTEIVK